MMFALAKALGASWRCNWTFQRPHNHPDSQMVLPSPGHHPTQTTVGSTLHNGSQC